MTMAGRLEGKVAIVTGGANGIGRATVKRFVAEGARVVIADIDEAAGALMEKECTGANGAAAFRRADVTVEADVKALVEFAVQKFGCLDVMFNNAGRSTGTQTIEDMSVEDWDFTMAICLRSVFLGMKYAVPAMRRGGGGSIFSTASVGGKEGRGEPGGLFAKR